VVVGPVRPACDEEQIQAKPAHAPVAVSVGFFVLVATILGSSMSFIDGTVVNVALPTIQRELHASAADVQWVVESYALFLCALILVGGSLGDRLGRRRVFAVGVVIFTIASVACGLAQSLVTLVVARAVQGVGGALLVPGSLSIISASFDDQRRGQAIGTWSAFTTVTSAIGPVLGGFLVMAASWRWVFFINLPLAAITLVMTYPRVPESRSAAAQGPLDWPGATLAVAGLGALTFGLIQASAFGFGATQVRVAILAGVVALAGFVVVERRALAPMMPLRLFGSRTFSGANLLTLFLYGALGGALYFLPFNLQLVQGYTPLEAGASLLPFTVIVFALSRWAGGLVPRVGARPPLVVGPLLVTIGFVLFARTGLGGSYWLTFFPAVVVLSLGMALVIAPLTTAVMSSAGQAFSGAASGINNAVSRTAGLLAIAVFNIIVVSVFSADYVHGLAGLGLPPDTQAALAAQRTSLAAVRIPAGLSASAHAAVQHTIATSFISGFRAAMLCGAGLALASAVAAAFLIEGKHLPGPAKS
jgi:EmrB/QacA subfamily drug resistance transporter